MSMKIGEFILPDIPEEVKAKYPYLAIVKECKYPNSDNIEFIGHLYGSYTKMVYAPASISKKMFDSIITSQSEGCHYILQQDYTSWEFDSTNNKVVSLFINVDDVLIIDLAWSNHDINTITSYYDNNSSNPDEFESAAFDSDSMQFTVGTEVYFNKSIKFDYAWYPGIPTDVLEVYPYVIVQKITHESGDVGYLFEAANGPYVHVGREIIDSSIDNIILQVATDEKGTVVIPVEANKSVTYSLSNTNIWENPIWEKLIESTTIIPKPIGNAIGESGENLGYYELVWSNHDIYEAASYNYSKKEYTIGSEIYFENSYLTKTSDRHYKEIATKVREILGESTQYKPRELPDAIKNTSGALQFPYNITTGVEYRKESANVVGGVLYPGLYTPDDFEITLPNNITEIAKYGLKYISFYLQKLICNEGLTKIGDYALYYAYALTELKLPKSLTSIGEYAFYAAGELTELELPENLTNIGANAFYDCKITNLTIPKNVATIGISAFESCEALTEVNILCEQLDSLYGTFGYCSTLKRVDIKGNVSQLYGRTFYNCTALEAVILRGDFCSLPYISPFQNSSIASGTGYIYVPSALLDKYKTTETWSAYASQIRAIEDYPDICDPTE